MSRLRGYLQLVRVKQWYKNVVMFIGVFFGGQLLNFSLYFDLIVGFVLCCLASSLNYIVNDIADVESDRVHPEKRLKRPLAAGTITMPEALLILAIAAGAIIVRCIIRFDLFALLLLVIVVNGLLYNFVFKRHAFQDIIALSMIYVWRALAGCAIAEVMISPWLFLAVFFVALFLAICKRRADLELLGEEQAVHHKAIYAQYSKEIIDIILVLVANTLFIIYIMYCILGPLDGTSIVPEDNHGLLIYSIPLGFYLLVRYIYLTKTQPEVARSTEKVVRDKGMVIGALLFVLINLICLYFETGDILAVFGIQPPA